MNETVDTSGFYAYFDNYLQYSDNCITFPDGTTLVETLHDTYTYPYEGWYYFTDVTLAEKFFGILNAGITDSLS